MDRSIFSGRISNTVNNNATFGVGGLVGVMIPSATPPEIRNSEVSRRADIRFFTASINGGGLIGFGGAAAGKLTRSLMQGFLNEFTASLTINGLVGNGTFVNTASFDLTSTHFIKQPSASVIINYVAPECVFDFGATDFIPVTAFGSAKVSDEFAPGILTREGVGMFKIRSIQSEDSCNEMIDKSASMSGTADLYEARSLPSFQTATTLRAAGYDVSRFTIQAEKDRVLNAYIAFLKNEPVVNSPVWIFEPEQDGLSLFNIKD